MYGYLAVTMSCEGRKQPMFVHRLVAMAFVPNPDNKPEVNHINLDKHDNRAENLEWVTRAENLAHAHSNGADLRGSKNGQSRLTEAEVISIRTRYAQTEVRLRELAEEFGVSASTLSLIVKGRAWAHVGGPLTFRGSGRRPGSPRRLA